jgi:endogenous inhibitor of DNA gyrase (YacG/DUF329 family)
MGSRKPPDGQPLNGKTVSFVPTGKVARCPICTAPTEAAFRPFCSRRCADVDLSRWLRGGYAIPGRADVDEDGEDTIAASAPRLDPDSDDDPVKDR